MASPRGLLFLTVSCAVVATGCDGSLTSASVDAGSPGEGAGATDLGEATTADARTTKPADAHVIEDATADARVRSDAPRDLSSASLPPNVAPPSQIVAGKASLVGAGTTACTHQQPPSGNGDRWCAFKRPASGATGTELWVFNLTAAIGGRSPVCDGTTTECLRLTDSLWTEFAFGGPAQEDAHRFDGDTLFFRTVGSSAPDEALRGPIWAWRPGWAEAQMLVSSGLICYGHGRLPLAFCIDEPDKSAAIEFDLRAGPIAQASFEPLPKIDRARLRRSDYEYGFEAGFSDDGQQFVYSTTGSADSNVASLRIVRTDQMGAVAPREILPDVMSWQVANDGQRIYFLTSYSSATAEGMLMIADFPTGENARQLARRTGRYVVLGDGSDMDRGVGYFSVNSGRFLSEYRVIPDRDTGVAHTVFTYKDLLEDFHLSRNQRYTGYAKVDAQQGFNGYIARTDGSGECILNSELGRPAFEYLFLDSATMVFWAEESDEDSTVQDAWFADPDGCRDKHRFASGIAYYMPISDEGLLFGDEAQGETMTLKYARIEGGRGWPADGPVKIQERVDRPPVIVGPDMRHVLFQVSHAPDQELGIYLFGPLPLGPR